MSGKHLRDREKEKIVELAGQGLSPNRIAQRLARSPRTISKYVADPAIAEKIAVRLETLALDCLDSVCERDIEKANLVGKVTAAAIAIDKFQLLRGRATQIDVHILLDAVSAIKELRRNPTIIPAIDGPAVPADDVIEAQPAYVQPEQARPAPARPAEPQGRVKYSYSSVGSSQVSEHHLFRSSDPDPD